MKNILILILGLFLVGCRAPVKYLKSEFVVSEIEHHYNNDGGSYSHYKIRLEQIYETVGQGTAFEPVYLYFRTPTKPDYKIGDILILTAK